MLDIRIIAVGKKHHPMFAPALAEYEARLRRYCRLNWDIIAPSGVDDESARIAQRLPKDATTILFDQRGVNVTSERLTKLLDEAHVYALPELVCIIGGAYGVTSEIRSSVDHVFSLGSLVFPHQLVRVILLEQLYRSYDTLGGGKYHHA